MSESEPRDASPVTVLQPGWVTVRCTQCQGEFACGAGGHPATACWCTTVAPVAPVLADPARDAGCLCPECLKARARAQHSAREPGDSAA